jgi:hypothetical protein
VADDLGREPVTGVAGAEGHGHPARLPVPACHRKPAAGNLTVPGGPLLEALTYDDRQARLDIGCVAAHGIFSCDADGSYTITPQSKPATAFLLELIARLQDSATVPMIDVRAYARWLTS